jgi:hypothetical protein
LWALSANRPIGITLKGGYDASFSSNILETVLQGTVLLQQGTVVMERIKLR